MHRHTSYRHALCDKVTEDTTIFDEQVTCKKCLKIINEIGFTPEEAKKIIDTKKHTIIYG